MWTTIAILLVLAGCGTGLGVVLSKRKQSSNNDTDRCPIFCDSEILATVQMKNVFNSSKTFVDMSMLYDPAQIERKFEALKREHDVQSGASSIAVDHRSRS